MAGITSFLPIQASRGQAVTITGIGFTGATAVRFGGIDAASFVIANDLTILATLADGASGSVEVVTLAGLVSLAGFVFNPIKVKMPQSPAFADDDAPAGEDLVWIWDVSTGVLRKAPVSSLPFTDGGGLITTDQPSPFMITNDMDGYSYDAGTGETTIKDVRLLNRSFYPVSTTQFGGGEFRLSQLTYEPVSDDPTMGAIVISAFQLEDGEHVTITLPGSGSASDPVYNQLIADVAALKLMTAPFKPTALSANGGKVWWTGTADTIPPGWQECVAMRGWLPMAQDTAQADFAVIGHTAGAKSKKLVAANIPELSTTIKIPLKIEDVDRGGGHSNFSIDNIDEKTVTVGTPDADMVNVNILNPYKVGLWIEFIGL